MILEEGYLTGAIKGFHDTNTIFQFNGGGTWAQTEYKYVYQYLYSPYAQVMSNGGQIYIQIEGIDEIALVRKI